MLGEYICRYGHNRNCPIWIGKNHSSCILATILNCTKNTSPVLEMVTEKYLLREEEEWHARHRSMEILDGLLAAFRESDVKKIGGLVTEK